MESGTQKKSEDYEMDNPAKLCIRGLPKSASFTEEELKNAFSRFGRIIKGKFIFG